MKMTIPMHNQRTTEGSHEAKHQSTPLPAGVAGPDFTLKSTPDQTVIRWSYVSPVGIHPGADGILKALGSMAQRNPQVQHVAVQQSLK